ncbi:hypothetical protein M422DRAFT_272912 [Sphaerobolus stellatus SS14]|uniref:Unplaced genomic scaffold SPHSTscaffold_311, whole genome shotgun sequence n=1 Tax=Sphaerobolus stellatus (strain SS14) TaxID=990650 RepID=A0A0C9TW66_SPHS4|nr:hypothetical protein M422DRAFT_272912 [Sphaerobolus stellatus SS14]
MHLPGSHNHYHIDPDIADNTRLAVPAYSASPQLELKVQTPHDDMLVPWASLTDSDLVMSEWMDEHRLWREKGEIAEAETSKKGKGRRELLWLWKLEFEVTTNMVGHDQVADAVDRWTTEAIRIEWLHAQASMERFDEEVRLLEAASGRIPRTFAYLEDRWENRAGSLKGYPYWKIPDIGQGTLLQELMPPSTEAKAVGKPGRKKKVANGSAEDGEQLAETQLRRGRSQKNA